MNRIVVLVGFMLCMCGQAFAAAPDGPVAVIYSGQIMGHIEPCPT